MSEKDSWTEVVTNDNGVYQLYYSATHKRGVYPFFVECVRKFKSYKAIKP